MLLSISSRRLQRSPISAGRERSLLFERSNLRRLWRREIEGGIRNKELSFRYRAFKCCSFHNCGDRFLIVPVISNSGQLVVLPLATSSWLRMLCDLLLSNRSRPAPAPLPINMVKDESFSFSRCVTAPLCICFSLTRFGNKTEETLFVDVESCL